MAVVRGKWGRRQEKVRTTKGSAMENFEMAESETEGDGQVLSTLV